MTAPDPASSLALHKDRDAVRKSIKDALNDAWRDDVPRDFLGELLIVTDIANVWASRLGVDGVTLRQVEAIDRTAMGHVDWFDKLTLRVADLVVFGSDAMTPTQENSETPT